MLLFLFSLMAIESTASAALKAELLRDFDPYLSTNPQCQKYNPANGCAFYENSALQYYLSKKVGVNGKASVDNPYLKFMGRLFNQVAGEKAASLTKSPTSLGTYLTPEILAQIMGIVSKTECGLDPQVQRCASPDVIQALSQEVNRTDEALDIRKTPEAAREEVHKVLVELIQDLIKKEKIKEGSSTKKTLVKDVKLFVDTLFPDKTKAEDVPVQAFAAVFCQRASSVADLESYLKALNPQCLSDKGNEVLEGDAHPSSVLEFRKIGQAPLLPSQGSEFLTEMAKLSHAPGALSAYTYYQSLQNTPAKVSYKESLYIPGLKKFTDCMETGLLNFIQFAFRKDQKTLNSELLKTKIDPKAYEFFKSHNFQIFDDSFADETRKKWLEVLYKILPQGKAAFAQSEKGVHGELKSSQENLILLFKSIFPGIGLSEGLEAQAIGPHICSFFTRADLPLTCAFNEKVEDGFHGTEKTKIFTAKVNGVSAFDWDMMEVYKDGVRIRGHSTYVTKPSVNFSDAEVGKNLAFLSQNPVARKLFLPFLTPTQFLELVEHAHWDGAELNHAVLQHLQHCPSSEMGTQTQGNKLVNAFGYRRKTDQKIWASVLGAEATNEVKTVVKGFTEDCKP